MIYETNRILDCVLHPRLLIMKNKKWNFKYIWEAKNNKIVHNVPVSANCDKIFIYSQNTVQWGILIVYYTLC